MVFQFTRRRARKWSLSLRFYHSTLIGHSNMWSSSVEGRFLDYKLTLTLSGSKWSAFTNERAVSRGLETDFRLLSQNVHTYIIERVLLSDESSRPYDRKAKKKNKNKKKKERKKKVKTRKKWANPGFENFDARTSSNRCVIIVLKQMCRWIFIARIYMYMLIVSLSLSIVEFMRALCVCLSLLQSLPPFFPFHVTFIRRPLKLSPFPLHHRYL